MITQEDLENIKSIRSTITPGEWFPKMASWTVRANRDDDYSPLVADTYNDADTRFIANAPEYVDDLMEELERLTLAMSMISDCTPAGMVETKDGSFTVKQFAWRTLRNGKLVEDGCGNAWPPCKCGTTMQVVRPGHAVCPMCGGGE